MEFLALCLSFENAHLSSRILTLCIGVLRDFEVPHVCDSGTSSILFGWHKSAGHSSLVHSGLRSHREDSGAERAAASHRTLVLSTNCSCSHSFPDSGHEMP